MGVYERRIMQRERRRLISAITAACAAVMVVAFLMILGSHAPGLTPQRRIKVLATGNASLMESMLVLVAAHATDLEVRNIPALEKSSREIFATWLRTNLSASGGDTTRIRFLGPALANGQQMIVDYPEMQVRLYPTYIKP